MIMAEAKLSIHAVLDTGALELEDVPSVKRAIPSSASGFTMASSPSAPSVDLPLVLRQSLLDQAHTRVTPSGVTPAISSAKRSSSLTDDCALVEDYDSIVTSHRTATK